jgi:hypothetical protein
VNQHNFRNCGFTDVKLRTRLFYDTNDPLAIDSSSGVLRLYDDNMPARGRESIQCRRSDCQHLGGDCAQGELACCMQEKPWRSNGRQGGSTGITRCRALDHAAAPYM